MFFQFVSPIPFLKHEASTNDGATHFPVSQIPHPKQSEYWFHYQPPPTTPFQVLKQTQEKPNQRKNNNFHRKKRKKRKKGNPLFGETKSRKFELSLKIAVSFGEEFQPVQKSGKAVRFRGSGECLGKRAALQPHLATLQLPILGTFLLHNYISLESAFSHLLHLFGVVLYFYMVIE